MNPADLRKQTRRGQAIVEVIVGLVVILTLLAGLLQVVSLTRTQADLVADARSLAGEEAMKIEPISVMPDYLSEVTAGTDEATYSADDEHLNGTPALLNEHIIDHAVVDDSGWPLLETPPRNPLADLHNDMLPQTEFGLLRGRASDSVPLIPAVQHLLFDALPGSPGLEILIKEDVWMTWTRGIY